jgi:hypothetical protein
MFFEIVLWVLIALIPEPKYYSPTNIAIRNMQPDERVISESDVSRIANYIDIAATESGVDPNLLVVMTYGESRFDASIINLMQISQTWYKNSNAPAYCRAARKSQEASIRCGAFVLSRCDQLFRKEENKYLCWSGFHKNDDEEKAYLKRIKNRWNLIKG